MIAVKLITDASSESHDEPEFRQAHHLEARFAQLLQLISL